MPTPFPPAEQKKNNLTAKCEAALEEVEANPTPKFVPLQRKATPPPSSPRVTPPPPPQAPAQPPRAPSADDDFLSRYADFDEASVAPSANYSESFDSAAPTPSKNNEAILEAARNNIPDKIKHYIADRFQAQFTRVVPATEARIYTITGELLMKRENPESDSAETTDADLNEDFSDTID